MTSVLVTRPAGQADGLIQSLKAAGFDPVLHQPMLELLPLTDIPAPQRQCIVDLDLYQHIIFISANAVRFGLARIDDFWPQLPTGLNWYAIGESTAAILEDRGVAVLTPGEQMSSEGLLALPELDSVANQRVLIVKGVGGRDTLREVLSGRGAQVEEFACYRTVSELQIQKCYVIQ